MNINLDAWKEQLLTCKNALCDGKIKVTDINGPVELATVSYAGCNLGITNTQGVVETKIPCGISLLEVSKSKYTQYKDLYSSEELKDKNIYFNTNKIPSVKLNLYNLVLQKIGDTYTVKDVKPNDKELAISVVSGEVNTFGYVSLSEETNSSFLATSTIPPGIVSLSTIVREGRKTLGGITSSYFVPSIDQELWLYSPVLETGIISDKEGADQASEEGSYVFALSNVSVQCGLQISEALPISNQPIDVTKLKTCSVKT